MLPAWLGLHCTARVSVPLHGRKQEAQLHVPAACCGMQLICMLRCAHMQLLSQRYHHSEQLLHQASQRPALNSRTSLSTSVPLLLTSRLTLSTTSKNTSFFLCLQSHSATRFVRQ